MYALKDVAQIDIAAEIQAMTEFLSARWTQVENVAHLLRLIAQVAEENAENALGRDELPMYLMDKRQQREDVMDSFSEDGRLLRFYDQCYQLLENMGRQVSKIQRNADDMLYQAFNPAMASFKKALRTPELAHLRKAQPKSLRSMTKHYQKNDAAWDQALEDEFTDRHAFKGAETPYDGSGGFVSRVSLISVVQTKESHNTPCIDLLVEGAYIHFIHMYKHRNSKSVIADLEMLKPQVLAKNPIFVLDFAPAHKLTRALYTLAQAEGSDMGGDNPEQAYHQALAERKAAPPLTEEELKVRRAGALALLKGIMGQARKPETAKQRKAREAEEAREQRAVQEALKNA